MNYDLPGILLTGASGFVGRNFIKSAAGKFRLFCIARRSMQDAGVQPNPDLRWTQVDIADWKKLKDLIQRIKDRGGVDYTVHLAGYYDFTNKNNPEYRKTNVTGTENILEVSKHVEVKRFLFASSLAACTFPEKGTAIDEKSPPDADIPYAWSKRQGEKLVNKYSQFFPCTIIRMAAVFSDWCEYPPLYTLLKNWLAGGIQSRIIGGKGASAVPYIHVQDVAGLLLKVIEKSDCLERLCTYNASPCGATSHLNLFKTSTQYFFHKDIQPLCTPRQLLAPMILLKQILHWFKKTQPFEHLWMLSYIDKQLTIDSSRTFKDLSWEPTPRKSISRRLLFLIDNMQKHPDIWQSWNEAMLQRDPERPYLIIHDMIYDAMVKSRDEIIREIFQTMQHSFPFCPQSPEEQEETILHSYIRLAYQLIVTIIKTRDRPMMRQYAKTIAFLPLARWLDGGNWSNCLSEIGNYVSETLRSRTEFNQKQLATDNYIFMTINLAIDQIEDFYELLSFQSRDPSQENTHIPFDSMDFDLVTKKLEDLCQEVISGQSWMSPLA